MFEMSYGLFTTTTTTTAATAAAATTTTTTAAAAAATTTTSATTTRQLELKAHLVAFAKSIYSAGGKKTFCLRTFHPRQTNLQYAVTL
jgi:hypothetical protein